MHDVQLIMDRLAENRAKACLAALVESGVPAAQLYSTFKGRGGTLRVDFIPCGASSSTASRAAAAIGRERYGGPSTVAAARE